MERFSIFTFHSYSSTLIVRANRNFHNNNKKCLPAFHSPSFLSFPTAILYLFQGILDADLLYIHQQSVER